MSRRVISTTSDELRKHEDRLIPVAVLRPGPNGNGEVAPAEAKLILRIAGVISHLVTLLLRIEWDRYFLVADRTVFIRFVDDNLLLPNAHVAEVVHAHLSAFEEWRDARILLLLQSAAGEATESSVIRTAGDIEKAQSVIERYQETMSPSGIPLDQVFSIWMRHVAKVAAFEFSLPSVGPDPKAFWIPAVSRIRPTKGALSARLEKGAEKEVLVGAVEEMVLVQGVNGAFYLVRCEDCPEGIEEGASISFELEESRSERVFLKGDLK